MKKLLIISFLFLGFTKLQAQQPFIGGMIYNEVYNSKQNNALNIFQFNAGISFEARKNLYFDIVPIQVSAIVIGNDRTYTWGWSVLWRYNFGAKDKK